MKFSRSVVTKALVVGWISLSLSVMGASRPKNYILPDHLLPVDFTLFPKFRALLAEKLCPTAFDFGRVVIEYFPGGEESLSIHSAAKPGEESTYLVTYFSADAGLRDFTNLGRDSEEAKKIHVRRIDAELPERTAGLLKRVWVEMLRGTKPIQQSERSAALVFGDAANAEFSINAAGRVIYGETVFVPGGVGKRTKELVELVDLLTVYCKSEPTARPAIATKIDRKAARLLEILNTND